MQRLKDILQSMVFITVASTILTVLFYPVLCMLIGIPVSMVYFIMLASVTAGVSQALIENQH